VKGHKKMRNSFLCKICLWVCRGWRCFCNECKRETKDKIRKVQYEDWERAKQYIKQAQREEELWRAKEGKEQVQNSGCILSWLRYIFALFYLLSFSKWISGTQKKQEKIRKLDLRPYRCIDIYVTVWFVIEVAVASSIALCYWPVIYSQSTLSHVFALFLSGFSAIG